jgi:phosphodiesterase/alkaline phosphatase D-like protein
MSSSKVAEKSSSKFANWTRSDYQSTLHSQAQAIMLTSQQHEKESSFSSLSKPSRIAFGSCNDQDRQNNLWKIIGERNPAAFIWGGDSIYADKEIPTDWNTFPPTPPRHECGNGERVRQLYREQLAVPGYRELLKQNITMFGTLDGA